MAVLVESKNTSINLNSESKNNNGNSVEHPINFSGSTLDWYKLTETSRHVLSQVISASIQHQLTELDKPNPNQEEVNRLIQISFEASKLSRDSKNFKSKERMLEIISNYSNFAF